MHQHLKNYWGLPLVIVKILIMSNCISSHCQERAIGTLPLVNNGSVVTESANNLNDTEDYENVKKIYDDLVNARGDYRYPVPRLFLSDREQYGAFIDYNTNEITLEKKALDVCMKHGNEAIAFMLGHELTHYYEKHAWKGTFAKENVDLTIGSTLGALDTKVLQETEADYLGGFLAYTAGYGMFDKSDEIIKDLYKTYNLDNSMAGYPILSDRIKLSNRTTKKLEALVDVFEMANYLLAADRTAETYALYDYILKFYQSNKLYNNLGTIAVNEALKLFKPHQLKFKYVNELDINFKVSRNNFNGSRNTDVPIDEQINTFLDNAILQFKAAINLDPSYAPAYLNKANAYALKREWTKAEFYLNEEALPIALKNATKYKKTLEDITILQGIIAAETGDTATAKIKFASLSQSNRLADQNLKALNGEVIYVSATTRPLKNTDAVGGMTIEKFLLDKPVNLEKSIGINGDITFHQYSPDNENYKIFYIDKVQGRRKLRMVMIYPTEKYEGSTSKSIKIGSTLNEVITAYGDPISEIETTEGQLLTYDNLFFITADNKVLKWINYGTTVIR